MAKEAPTEEVVTAAAPAAVEVEVEKPTPPLFPGQGEPLADPRPYQAPPPSEAQIEWFRKNPHYVRSSHASVQFAERGTLHADGTYARAHAGPVLDGMAGSIGVGVPVLRRR